MRFMRYALIALALIVLPLTAHAQTKAATTTLGAAIAGANTATMTVASATGFTVGNYVLIDLEVVQITSVNGTTIGILRGQLGSAAVPHATSRRVITGALAHFQNRDPNFAATSTRGAGDATFSPFINVLTGDVFMCGTSGMAAGASCTWTVTNIIPLTQNSIPTSF